MDEFEKAHAMTEEAIAKHDEAGRAFAELASEEMRLEAERAEQKRDAIARIMAATNELTGKPHSASSAETIVGTDQIYFRHLMMQSRTVRDKNLAHTALQSARLRAELLIALIKTQAVV